MNEQERNESSLPASAHAESTILGCCLIDQNAVNDAIELLTAEDFSLDSNRKIFRCISELAETGNPVDYLTVTEDLRRRKEVDAVGGLGYVADLSSGVPRNFNVVAYCKIVKEKAVLRSLISLCEVATARASDQSEPSSTILEDAEERIMELAQVTSTQQFITLADQIKEAGGFDEYVESICDPAEMTGLSTGYADIDKVWGGMHPKTLIIVAARPSMGKTGWALNIATNVVIADPEKVVAVFSIESSKESLQKRVLASVAEVSLRRALEGFLGVAEKARFVSATLRMSGCNIKIDDSSTITVLQMRAKCRRLKQQMGRLDLIVVDYLQLMRGVGKHGSREQEVSSVSRGLKALAKELDVPVVALAQLSRKNEERGDKRPVLSDLRESGSIEQDADIVAFIHREEYYKSEDDPDCERGIAEINTAKNREGPTGTRKLVFRADITRFDNLEVRR